MTSLPPLPNTQVLSSETFRLPPLDGSLSPSELYEWHLLHSSEHVIFEYLNDNDDVNEIRWTQAVPAIRRAAEIIRRRIPQGTSGEHVLSKSPPIVAIVAPSETIPYFTTIMGILRMGFTCFPISPRNSAAALAHLISKTSPVHILVGRDQAMHNLVNDAFSQMRDANAGVVIPGTSELPHFEELYLRDQEREKEDQTPPPTKVHPDAPAIILHSSGTTAFPKPIPWTHATLIRHATSPYFGEIDFCALRFSIHSIPMYHAMGIVQLLWAASCGHIMTAFDPSSALKLPSSDVVLREALSTRSDLIFCVPSFIEGWAKMPDEVDRLSRIKGLLYGGGPLSKATGDYLTQKGVCVLNLYGCTETGITSPLLSFDAGDDWEYFKFRKNITAKCIPDGNGRAELVIMSNPFNIPSVINTVIDGVEGYATSDLFTEHPTRPGFWKIYGRTDDQLMHTTGEKTNPGPLEHIMNQDPHVQASVMFGRGRFQPGILIEPKPDFAFNPHDELQLSLYRNKIWPTVEKLNEYAPQHSRIFKECIIVTSPSKPFTYTAKNTVRRHAIIAEYQPEIDAMYDLIEQSTQAELSPPSIWDYSSTLAFVRQVVMTVLKDKSLTEDDNLFTHGCDSLQATWIRNTILRAVRITDVRTARRLPQNFVYQNSTISALTQFILKSINGNQAARSDEEAVRDRVSSMLDMVEKYAAGFPVHTPVEPAISEASGDVVLLTGTTGALGCGILAELANRPHVRKVFALNRVAANGISLRERQELALRQRGMDPSVLESSRIVLLEGDTSKHDLGLEARVLLELRPCVTHIIHNAWRVDFNISLASFEDNIKGIRHLIDFALLSGQASPPTLLFISSIGVFNRLQTSEEMEEVPVQPDVAAGTGYSESKWCGEEILSRASRKTPLHTVSVRVGQICGGRNGSWNTAEWLPSMVRSGINLGCLPKMDGVVSWIPLHMASSALADFCHSSSTVLHLTHPKPVAWNDIFTKFASNLDIPLVTFEEWIEKLETSARIATNDSIPNGVDQMKTNPALRILDFYRSAADRMKTLHSAEAMGFPTLSMKSALVASTTLQYDAQALSAHDVHRWLEFWRSIQAI